MLIHIQPPPSAYRCVPRGLGVACFGADQILQYALGAGFPQDVATQMVAIALRESGGCPGAHNPGSPPGSEDSYGLWQINVKGNPTILSRLGLSNPSQLYDPATNAAAAYILWGGNAANLNTAWYINQPGYQESYLANLPIAQAAADALGPASDASLAAFPTLAGVPTWAWMLAAVAGIVFAGEVLD